MQNSGGSSPSGRIGSRTSKPTPPGASPPGPRAASNPLRIPSSIRLARSAGLESDSIHRTGISTCNSVSRSLTTWTDRSELPPSA